jgi:hypothetical protein
MRKTNNREGSGSEQSEGDFWVVSDADTGEHLIAVLDYALAEGIGLQYRSAVWKDILIEEGIDGGVADIEPSARFESEDDARAAAQSLADQIAQEHPDDPVCLLISKLSVETVEMVIATESVGEVERQPARGEDSEPDDDGTLARRPKSEGDDDEGLLEPEDDWSDGGHTSQACRGWSALNEEPESKKPKKVKGSKKEKKSTRKS